MARAVLINSMARAGLNMTVENIVSTVIDHTGPHTVHCNGYYHTTSYPCNKLWHGIHSCSCIIGLIIPVLIAATAAATAAVSAV